MADFKDAWTRFHSADIPVGNHTHYGKNINSTRFHVLPNSEEIAKNYGEIIDILHRHDALAKDLLGDKQPCWMVVPEWQDPTGHPDHVEVVRNIPTNDFEEQDAEVKAWLAKRDEIWRLRIARICKTYRLTCDWSFYDPADEAIYDVHAGLVTWELSRFKKLLLNIYRERVRDIFWMNPENGAIFAPYHAGIDIRVPSAEQLHLLRRKYETWLPSNGCGFLYLSQHQ